MKYKKNVFKSLSMITQFGINMIVPIILCSGLGMYIDKKIGTSQCVVIMFFVGALAGFRNVYLFSKAIYSEDSEKDTARETKKQIFGRPAKKKNGEDDSDNVPITHIGHIGYSRDDR